VIALLEAFMIYDWCLFIYLWDFAAWYMVLAHLSKSNSRTFQGLSRTIQRIYMEN